MRFFALFCFSAILYAQDAGVLRGVLLERDSDASGGEFAVRAPDFHVHRFRFDAKTSVDREHQTIDVPGLRPGEQVEVVSDQTSDDPLRHARTVHVTVPLPPPVVTRPAPAARLRQYSAAEERRLPKGDLSFSGVVVRLDGSRLTLRTRAGVEQTILLRQDTRYLENGEITAIAALKPTMRVFVRAGKNVYGDVEGYQVAWGGILEVK
jgi:hypothetical protein